MGTQWVDVVKPAGKYESRLVARGDQESDKVRSDSPELRSSEPLQDLQRRYQQRVLPW